MNKKHSLTFKNPNSDHKHRKLNGHIRGENYDFFVIESNPLTHRHELIVKSRTPIGIGMRKYNWYLIAEGSYDYCLGFLHGKYEKIDIKRRK